MDRRSFLAALSALAASAKTSPTLAFDSSGLAENLGNFAYVYSDPVLRGRFLDFLTNVFHLYPENDFHETLTELVTPGAGDRQVYEALQEELPKIAPFLGALRYAIPALKKQKAIMARQTAMLLDDAKRYDGYLEVGTTGRYINALHDRLDVQGDVFLLHTVEAGYGPEDIVERGQLRKIGTHIDLADYSSAFAATIGANSLDLVTVYIGFHHCPLDKRREFVSSIVNVLRPGGTLILRDHDAHNEDMWRIAALAHDTFNAGINLTWSDNENEVRNFYSLPFIIDYLEGLGLRHHGKVHFQRGDPTRNGLMAFSKV